MFNSKINIKKSILVIESDILLSNTEINKKINIIFILLFQAKPPVEIPLQNSESD